MKNLVIGNTSQLARYFPDSYVKISSRNIDIEFLKSQKWDSVYICFAEQKTYKCIDSDFDDINFTYTKTILEKLKATRIVFYSTAELWNNCVGEIDLNTPYFYHKTDYVSSKEKITNFIKNNYTKINKKTTFW